MKLRSSSKPEIPRSRDPLDPTPASLSSETTLDGNDLQPSHSTEFSGQANSQGYRASSQVGNEVSPPSLPFSEVPSFGTYSSGPTFYPSQPSSYVSAGAPLSGFTGYSVPTNSYGLQMPTTFYSATPPQSMQLWATNVTDPTMASRLTMPNSTFLSAQPTTFFQTPMASSNLADPSILSRFTVSTNPTLHSFVTNPSVDQSAASRFTVPDGTVGSRFTVATGDPSSRFTVTESDPSTRFTVSSGVPSTRFTASSGPLSSRFTVSGTDGVDSRASTDVSSLFHVGPNLTGDEDSRRTVAGDSSNTIRAEVDTTLESLITQLAADTTRFGAMMQANNTAIDARCSETLADTIAAAEETLLAAAELISADETLVAGSKRSSTTAFPGSTSSSNEGSPKKFAAAAADNSFPGNEKNNWKLVVRRRDGTWGQPTKLHGQGCSLDNEEVTPVKIPHDASREEFCKAAIATRAKKLLWNYRRFAQEIVQDEVGALLVFPGKERNFVFKFGKIKYDLC